MATCMIVDDEPLSRDILRKYIGEVKDLELLAECKDGIEATHRLGQLQVDILFLDINMPGLTGISLARSLKNAPLIIFTTAYPEFAVEGFELNALDYLIKPYSLERFLKAVNRALAYLSAEGGQATIRKIIVKAGKKLYALEAGDILFVEGQGDYIRIHMEEKRLMVHDTLKNFMESLPETTFMRVHKSWVVNLEKISFVEGNQIKIASERIPVSPTSREELLERYSAS
jgi:two-component system, LytTR family, response regulator